MLHLYVFEGQQEEVGVGNKIPERMTGRLPVSKWLVVMANESESSGHKTVEGGK